MKFNTFLACVVALISGGICGIFSYAGGQSYSHAALLGGIVGGTLGVIARIVLHFNRS